MADSYSLKYKTNLKDLKDYKMNNDACFSSFNCAIARNTKYVDEAIMIIEPEKYQNYSDEELDLFFENIQKAGTLKFTVEKDDDKNLLLKLVIPSNVKKSELVYTGMLVRTLYEPRKTDQFQKIARHFMNMCKLFKNRDRGILFTTACNIFITEYEKTNDYSIFNGNHILMEGYSIREVGCSILKTKNIKKILKLDRGINPHFTNNTVRPFSNFKIESSPEKKEYLKIFKKNGIKYR
jgi:hypothetical protein